jgi:hypothetical protein
MQLRRWSSPPSSATTFWTLATFMRSRKLDWMPTGAYELRRKVTLAGKVWTLCWKLHITSELDESLDDWAGLRFVATITIWPPKADDDKRRRTPPAWYAAARRTLIAHGFTPSWHRTPGIGEWADFTSSLDETADVHRVARLFERLSRNPAAIMSRKGH